MQIQPVLLVCTTVLEVLTAFLLSFKICFYFSFSFLFLFIMYVFSLNTLWFHIDLKYVISGFHENIVPILEDGSRFVYLQQEMYCKLKCKKDEERICKENTPSTILLLMTQHVK